VASDGLTEFANSIMKSAGYRTALAEASFSPIHRAPRGRARQAVKRFRNYFLEIHQA
jgi:hypothetical protein